MSSFVDWSIETPPSDLEKIRKGMHLCTCSLVESLSFFAILAESLKLVTFQYPCLVYSFCSHQNLTSSPRCYEEAYACSYRLSESSGWYSNGVYFYLQTDYHKSCCMCCPTKIALLTPSSLTLFKLAKLY